MATRTLVIGGTGPTGPFIVNGLRERGHEVTIFHRGTHEIPEIPDDVTHIHGDPHFTETIDEALAGLTFDVVVASYGRIRLIAEALAGRVGRFISVGGFALYRGFSNPHLLHPAGLPALVREDQPVADDETEERFSMLIAQTEQAVFRHHPAATIFRYPYVYGPYQLVPREWSIVRRILDGRTRILVPDAGHQLATHGWAGNLGHAVLLAVDHPEASAGRSYNCGDLDQYSINQIVEIVASELGAPLEPVAVPWAVAGSAKSLVLGSRQHQLMDLFQLRTDLGYTDALPAAEAIARTARWYADNRPDASVEDRMADNFDYAWEDRMLDQAGASLARWGNVARQNADGTPYEPERQLSRTASGKAFLPHPYAHPKDVGQATDHRGR